MILVRHLQGLEVNALQYLSDISEACGGFFSMEKPCTKASGSEFRRWITQSSVVINGQVIRDPKAKIDLPVVSFVLFPKSPKKRITIL